MKVLITGTNGFIGRNLDAQLGVRAGFEVLRYTRESTQADLERALAAADFVCHIAGVNRPDNDAEFAKVNTGLTETLVATMQRLGRHLPVIFASSVHVDRNNAYGDSKLAAERVLLRYADATGVPVFLFRLSHVIGKWCRPNYNSVVATFCHNIARDLPIQINDPSYALTIVYIDDLVETFARVITGELVCGPYCEASPQYHTTVGELAAQLTAFRESRQSLLTERVGSGLARALHATYLSYLPVEDFAYPLPQHTDPRGTFVEVLKTHDSGQFSFFTAHPGVTRGGHYHHSKTEKFLVIKGTAKFRFRHILTGASHELVTDGARPQVVETIPGWAHDITNAGADEMVVMLWANEVFDRDRPDTYLSPL